MNIRPFEWRDLPLLHSYRKRGLFLDSARTLTRGEIMIPMGALLTFAGLSTRIFTFRSDGRDSAPLPLVGQVSYSVGATFARLSFLAPDNAMELSELLAMSDTMAVHLGEQGAFHILADVDESSQAYQLLRRAGFAIYARQQVWQLTTATEATADVALWRGCRSKDTPGVRSLYCNVVPGLVQQVEPLPKNTLKGMVLYQEGDLRAFVELKYGRKGIWVQPFVHPDAQGFDQHLMTLLRSLPGKSQRPLYICIRSYQSWLEPTLAADGALPIAQQAVMVRHLTVSQRVKQAYPVHAMNGTRAEPTAPIAQIDDSHYLERMDVEKHHPGNSIP